MEPVQFPVDAERDMWNAWSQWIEADHKKTVQMVQWHDEELLLTGIFICAILVIEAALAWDIHSLRKEIRRDY